MNILLINPPYAYIDTKKRDQGLGPPHGLGYLAANLQKYGHEVVILDGALANYSWKRLEAEMKKHNPDIVGISFITKNRFPAFKVIKIARNMFPDCMIVAGGPHPSLAVQDTLEHIEELDVIVIGEGEQTIVELAQVRQGKRTLSDVSGIAYLEKGETVMTDRRERLNLDDLPFPARELYYHNNFMERISPRQKVPLGFIVSSRGCPGNCSFCSSVRVWGKWKARTPGNVMKEIELLYNSYGKRVIWFVDNNFTADMDRVEEICDRLIHARMNLEWICYCRTDGITFSLLEKMKKSGCREVIFGLESGSQRILDEVIAKGTTLEQNEKVLQWCDQLEILKMMDFIISHPSETVEDLEKTMLLIRKYGRKNAVVAWTTMHPYPGTKIYKMAIENGLLPPDFSWADERFRGYQTLSAVHGDVPIFVDKLSWFDFSKVLVELSAYEDYSLWSKMGKAIKDIHSFSDLKKYGVLGFELFKQKISGNLDWDKEY
ncbi:MAG: cobalamin-dependent protein [Candidatus Krumholzibacteriota bacterium]|nr:cobalamin-dependent protein [Candidatus Krumholzibacteriota bacterium]